MKNKTVIELQGELTSLIWKKNTVPNLVNIDKLINEKRDQIQKALEINANYNEKK